MLTKLELKPGINRDVTNYANEGGWYEANKVRFFSGYPQKIGGWTKATVDVFVGCCRSLFIWVPEGANNYMALGTNEKIYVEAASALYDITPIRQTFVSTDTDNCFQTDGSTTTVRVNITAHGAVNGDYVTFSGATAVGGVPADELNTEHKISSIISANAFTITVTTASTSVVAAGGGTAITAAFQLNIGYETNTQGFGWGTDTWGAGGWGYASTSGIYFPLMLYHFQKYYSDLLFNQRFGDIFIWEYTSALNTRGVYLKNQPGATDVPEEVTQILMAQENGHLLAFGCTPYGGGDKDPLLIRWSNQSDITNWTINDLTTAGYLRVSNGSAIIKAAQTYQEILVWTESSISSLQFTGTIDVFSITELSPSISLLAPNTVAVVKNSAYWMGHDKFYIYNGRVETLACTLLRHVFDDLNFDQSDQFFAGINENYYEIWWFYCSSGSEVIDKYVIYNYEDGSWSYGDCTEGLDRSAWIDSPLRQYPQAASCHTKYVYNQEVGTDADGVAFTATITSSDMSIDNGDKYMLIRKLIPDIDFKGSISGSNPIVYFTLEPRNFPGANYQAQNAEGQDFEVPVQRSAVSPIERYTEQVFVRARARQIGITVSSYDKTGVMWRLGIPRIEGREDGRKA